MPRKITIIIEDFESGETSEGTISIKDNQTTNEGAIKKSVIAINDDLNAKTGSKVKIISTE